MNSQRRSFLKNTMAMAAATSFASVSKARQVGNNEQKNNVVGFPDLEKEVKRTNPDFIVYVPKSADGSTAETNNQHFLVFEGPDGSLMSVWTQATLEGHGDHRMVFSKSTDKGRTWAEPKFLAGVKAGEGKPIPPGTPTPEPMTWERPDYDMLQKKYNMKSMANWGYPMVSKSGRIYVVYNQFQGITDFNPQMTGTMDAVYSDDNGLSWSKPQTIPMKKSIWDHPDPSIPPNWIVWQMPHRDLQDRWYVGLTRWVSTGGPPSYETVCSFMRYENIDEDPEPKDIRISWFASDHTAVKVPNPPNPLKSVSQEPSIVRLPDLRLFCTMRTSTGYIWYTISEDDGETWTSTKPLLYHDHGRPVLSPLFCTPIYKLSDGRYILIHHPAFRTPELREKYDIPRTGGRMDQRFRRPAFIALGEYRPNAEQPIWFSESKFFFDSDSVPLGPKGMISTGGYGSFTTFRGENVYWYEDRKFFLLGRKITDELLADLEVPESVDKLEYLSENDFGRQL